MQSIKISSQERALVFAHYDSQNIIDDYILFNLKKLRPYYACIVFVTTSKLSMNEQHKISSLVDYFLERENVGSDFLSYRLGLLKINTFSNCPYEQIVLMNDSVYGPTKNLDSIFLNDRLLKADFFGLTDSYCLYHHIQSYFIAFNRPVFESPSFRKFWIEMQEFKNRFDIVYNYEIKLSRILFAQRFKSALLYRRSFIDFMKEVFFVLKGALPFLFKRLIVSFFSKHLPQSFLARRPYLLASGWFFALNPTHHLFESVSKKVPYLKVSYFKENPSHFDKKLNSAVDVIPQELRKLIENHIRRVTSSNQIHK